MDTGPVKHLEMIQAVISRLAHTSVLVKGWGLTVVSGLIALGAAKEGNPSLLLVAGIPLIAFALMDAYYLWLERMFRAHYARVRLEPEKYRFDMKIKDLKKVEPFTDVLKRPAVFIFWGALLVSDLLTLWILRG